MLRGVTEQTIERLRPIWEAADQAFRSDSSYVIEVAQASSALKARIDARGVGPEDHSGV